MNKKTYTIELTEDEMIRYYANKIVEDALSDCSEFNYCMDVDAYNDNGFVEFHQKEILNQIEKDQRVAEVYIYNKTEPHSFDMIFPIDYCPYYYEDNKLNPLQERIYLNMFINQITKISEFLHITTIRDLVRNFMDKYIEQDNKIDFDEKDEIYYCLKEHICNTGFNDKYIDKYEVYVTKENIKELIKLLDFELEKVEKRAYEVIPKISLEKVVNMGSKFAENKPFNIDEMKCFVCEENNIFLCVDNAKGNMEMTEFDNLKKCLDYIENKIECFNENMSSYNEEQEVEQ